MGSSTGRLFRLTTFGESHGGGLGCVVEGCPPGMLLDLDEIHREMARRAPGQSSITSARKEPDEVEILSGVFEGRTLGSPIGILVRNRDADPRAYEPFRDLYRPSHADYTTEARYGFRNWQGGGRASARETVGRVAGGTIARQVLRKAEGIEICAWVDQLDEFRSGIGSERVQRDAVESSVMRCPDPEASAAMESRVRRVRKEGDTVGGVIKAIARGVPAGLGDPVFDKLEADLAKAMLSLPAAKGFESGLGFGSLGLVGSQHNDPFVPGEKPGDITTSTNFSGGIQGGISNGMPIEISVAFKPVATIFKEQRTVNRDGEPAVLRFRGRHDACVLPRAVPIVEAMMALVLCDHLLRWKGQRIFD